MSDFVPALNFLLDDEDRGRSYAIATDNNGFQVIAGINQQFWPAEFAGIAKIPQAQRGPAVAAFYFRSFWAPNLAALQSQAVATKLFDCAVNMGFEQAVKLAQRAVNRFQLPTLAVDGVLGGKTVAALNRASEEVMLAALVVELEQFYADLVKAKPQDAPYLNTWLARARRIPSSAAPAVKP